MNNTEFIENAIANAQEIEQVKKPVGAILKLFGGELLPCVESITNTIANTIVTCKTIKQETIVKAVTAIEPAFETIADQFFSYLDKNNFKALILNDASYTEEEKKEMLETVTRLQTEYLEKKYRIITPCILGGIALVGVTFLGSRFIETRKAIRLKELSAFTTDCRWSHIENIAANLCESTGDILNPIRGIMKLMR